MPLSKKSLSKIESITLKIFLVCMIACAITVLLGIWTGTTDKYLYPAVPTLFVIGLANFLTWLPIVLYRILDSLKK